MLQRSVVFLTALFTVGLFVAPRTVAAQVTPPAGVPAPVGGDQLCDPAWEDCRNKLLDLISQETVGIDVAFWFMEDARYTAALKRKVDQGVRVRVLVDTRANVSTPLNADRLAEFEAALIPMRRRTASGILHWKMMLFEGLGKVQFSAANYSGEAFVYQTPYQNYVDEVIYFTSDASIVHSFMTKFDDLWTNTTEYTNYRNITGPLTREHDIWPIDPELNFAPSENYRTRAVRRYDAEDVGIDVIMYRITDQSHTNALIRAIQRGVPVRLLTEQKQYRDESRLWHSWNVDRLYMAGAQIRHRGHAGLLHQKSVLLREQQMTIFGSSNWTSPSASSQEEHNYFTVKPYFYQWFSNQFDRKWNNTGPSPESEPFVPLPPDAPAYLAPANLATDQGAEVTLRWHGGPWAHLYDVYFGTAPNPPLFVKDLPLGPSESSSEDQQFVVRNLTPGTTYYWRIVSKTMAQIEKFGDVRTFTTAGVAPPPPASGALGPCDILLYASRAKAVGAWSAVNDARAAGGARMASPNAGQPKLTTALASPADYFELTFTAEAGRPYRIWLRAIAQSDHYSNDSVHVQFSGSVDSSGAPKWRINSTSSTVISLEQGTDAGLGGWGWSDNGWDSLGPTVQFAESGLQTIRIQRREDGISIDQVMLSPEAFMSQAPGAPMNDTTIYPEFDGSGEPPPPPPPPAQSDPLEQVIHASSAVITGGEWQLVADGSAAGGMRLENPDAGQPKVVTASATPASYAEMSFIAEANTAYRIWLRLRAQGDGWANDSVHLQFSGAVTAEGAAMARIGTASSVEVNLEDCSGCGLAGWGWQDNGWGVNVLGPVIYFAEAGPQTIRVQRREDGVSIDQIVLSSSTYMNASPGAPKNDTTLLPASGSDAGGGDPPDEEPAPSSAPEVVLHAAAAATTLAGEWAIIADTSAAGGQAVVDADAGAAKLASPHPFPVSLYEAQFNAQADTAYRLWLRARAENDDWANDSVHVQFSGSMTESGSPVYRIGTTDSTVVALEDCSGCGMQGWGWQDNGWASLGPLIYFEADGPQTIRVQTREDGLAIDQIVLSPATYLTSAPGDLKNDTTILAESDEAGQ